MCYAMLLDEPEVLFLGTFWVILNPEKTIVWAENGFPCVFSSSAILEEYLMAKTELQKCTLVPGTWQEFIAIFRKCKMQKIILDNEEVCI